MAKIEDKHHLSIIIPTINEAGKLPLLLADLNRFSDLLEVNVVDASSNDQTLLVAKLAGAKIYLAKESNRGYQLMKGAEFARNEWLLFLHADCRLPKDWYHKINQIITSSNNKGICWYFTFKVRAKGIEFRIMEALVYLRSNLFHTPYGDQGLLINKLLYKKLGGYTPIHIMEDVDFIQKIKKKTALREINAPIYIDPRKWEKTNVLVQGVKNFILRVKWSKGVPAKDLSKIYYRDSKVH